MMITLNDFDSCGLKCYWTTLYYGIPYDIDISEAVSLAVRKCMSNESSSDIDYLAGLSETDSYEVSKVLFVLANREKKSEELEKRKILLVKADKLFKTHLLSTINNTEFEKKQDLVELWFDCKCPPNNGNMFFGKYNYYPSNMFYMRSYNDLYNATTEWISKEKNEISKIDDASTVN